MDIKKTVLPLAFVLLSLGINSADAQEFSTGVNSFGFNIDRNRSFSIEQRMFEKDTKNPGFRWGGYFSLPFERLYKKIGNCYLGSSGVAGKLDFGKNNNHDLVFTLGPTFNKDFSSLKNDSEYNYGFRVGGGIGLPFGGPVNDNKLGIDFFYGYFPKKYSMIGFGLNYKFDFNDLLGG